ncbi:MFS transporter [Actinomadura viridis]|uniref:DHA1 family chloramphenicol resistance protein-like MFS transporter n=1 Tax=Actinomadura viridis TaxID=58110 RepID=A0A931GLB0_9ACTN|nr:Cmx/CmrA family chloramphenicol efflux MFS transporter [Actinomadura viridis]MBG6087276.1 DHA1 family chloramphenicol resistance protein-like MFS transporter [Actinomadura viridis]
MPWAIYVLGFAIFAQGTSEFMLAGLLPDMAADLGVSVPAAGLLISAYAFGMVLGAPVLALATLRLPRRTSLLAFLGVFVLVHVAGALTPGYELLLASRLVGAFACAGFFGVAAVAAIDLVPADARGRALAIVIGGITVSTVLGVPGGTFIGQHLGWRAAFWTVAALSAVAMAGVAAALPGGRPEAPGPNGTGGTLGSRLREELRSMTAPGLWIAYGTSALSFSSMMATFSYLGVLLTGTTGLPESRVPAVLALFGAGSLIGIAVGGRVADAHPFATLTVGMTGVVAASAGIALGAGHAAAVIVLVPLLGAFGLATNPAVNVRVYANVGEARTLAGATVTSAFNVGNTLAPWLGGLAIGAGFGYRSPAWVGAGMAVAALGTVALGAAVERRAARRAVAAGVPAAPVTRGAGLGR